MKRRGLNKRGRGAWKKGDVLLTTLKTKHRADDKTAEDYNLEAGATLHLVLALRGGKR